MPSVFGDARDGLDIRHHAAGIGEALDEDRLGALGQRALEIFRVFLVDEMAGPAEFAKTRPELRERAAVKIARGDEFVARLQQREEGQELRRVPRGRRDRRAPALQRRDALLQHGDGRIAQARVHMAEIVQIEQRRGVLGVLEHIGRSLIDRRDPRAGRSVRHGAGVDRLGLESVVGLGARLAFAKGLARRRRRRAAGDDSGVDAAPGEFAAEPAIFDLETAVHHDIETGGARALRRRVVAHAKLHPYGFGADGDGFVDDRASELRAAENLHDVDRRIDRREVRAHDLAEQRLAGEAGIDGNDAIALALKIFHDEIAGPVPIGARADERDDARAGQNLADEIVGIV